jgi:hypothetical protein
VINPANETSIDRQRHAAMKASFQLLPGEAWPAESASPRLEATSSLRLSPSPPPPTLSSSSAHHRLSSDVVTTIIVGVLVVISLAAGLICVLCRHIRAKKRTSEDTAGIPTLPASRPSTGYITQPPNLDTPGQAVPYVPLNEKQFMGSAPNRHPAFGPNSIQETTLELEGERPRVN